MFVFGTICVACCDCCSSGCNALQVYRFRFFIHFFAFYHRLSHPFSLFVYHHCRRYYAGLKDLRLDDTASPEKGTIFCYLGLSVPFDFLFADRNPHEIRRLAGLRFGAESQNGEHCGDRPGEYANAVWRCCFKMRRFACVAIVFNGSSRF